MRVIITGAAGMLGQQMIKEYTKRKAVVYPLSRGELDITNYYAVKAALIDIRPHLTVNCAAYTNVDKAEKNKDEAMMVNGLGPRLLARACRRYNSVLLHISTDYIFNGRYSRPYLVSDIPNPINMYGISKLAGEQGVREAGLRNYIVRTSWLFGPSGRNFIKTILNLAQEKNTLEVVDDQRGCPTYTPDLARAAADLVCTGVYGTYHITNSGTTTWYGLACKTLKAAGLRTKIEPCRTEDFPRPARRPANSALDPFPLPKLLGYTLPTWEASLAHYIKEGF